MSGERKETRKGIKRKESGKKIQLHGDCWLYASCSLAANFFLRYDLNEIIMFPNYKRLFDGYTDEYGFPHECEEEFTTENFMSFVLSGNLERITTVYLENPLCHAEIYYNFLFYFIYFIGMKTNGKVTGGHTYLFMEKLIRNGYLKHYVFNYKEAYKTYLFEKCANHEAIHEIIEKIYFLIQRFYWTNTSFINFLPINSPEDFDKEESKELLKETLSKTYIGLNYYGYKSEKEILFFPCLYKELRPTTRNVGMIINSPHAIVLEKYINTIDTDSPTPKDWGIVVKDSNSHCRMILNKEQLEKFNIVEKSLFFIRSNPINNITSTNIKILAMNPHPLLGIEMNPELDVADTKQFIKESLLRIGSDKKIESRDISLKEGQDVWTEVQKVINESISFLFNDYNIVWTILYQSINKLRFILRRKPPMVFTDYDTEMGRGRKKRRTKKNKRRKKKKSY
jgi:hypothetical protein